MEFQWILLALFLVALIWGVSKALTRSMLKNSLRLGSVVIAFLITFAMQLSGVFQNIVNQVVSIFDLASMIPGAEGAIDLVSGLAATIVSPIFFGIVFLVLLWFIRVIIHFVVKIIDKASAKKAAAKSVEPKEEPVAEAPAEEPVAETPAEEPVAETPAEEPVAETPAEEPVAEAPAEEPVAETPAEEPVAETPAEEPDNEEKTESASLTSDRSAEITVDPADEGGEQTDDQPSAEETPAEPVAEVKTEPVAAPAPVEKAKKTKKKPYQECAWKRIVSIATGAISGLLVFAVVMMPMFYLMSIVSTATEAVEGSDADDSQVYKIVEVVDEYIASPYENSFVSSFFDAIGITGLMNETTKAGGKIVLDNGETVYADDVLKDILTHGLSAAAQITSGKSECGTVKQDVNAIISDPMVKSIVADVLMNVIGGIEVEQPEEDDLMGGLVNNFIVHYQTADKAVIEQDLSSLGNAIGVLAEERILASLISGNVDLEAMLEDEETLGDVVEAISGLSAFGPTIEGAFELGVEILGETLQIPRDDAEIYEHFVDDILLQMVKDENVSYDSNTIKYYVYNVAKQGVKVSSSNGVKGHSMFVSYVNHWQKVQSAFAHASEDKSYGYFTIDINGVWYIYDTSTKTIVALGEDNMETYKDKMSPVAGLINALTLKSSTKQLTRDNLNTILNAYVSSTSDEVSRELATRLLNKDSFTSPAVTVEKMMAAIDFSDWTEEERIKDSRLCVAIVMDLLELMDSLGSADSAEGTAAALDFVDEFGRLGETMDLMKQTSCINQLPSLLIEGLVKNEMLSAYMKPSIAFQINNIVENNNKSYADCMNQIAVNIRWAINAFGGENQ